MNDYLFSVQLAARFGLYIIRFCFEHLRQGRRGAEAGVRRLRVSGRDIHGRWDLLNYTLLGSSRFDAASS